ncbi:MAG: hypothetical protein IMF11_13730 [Proteobacteria bacterium]|nr:hypothetical protein [Pseudomonadota bacterium]
MKLKILASILVCFCALAMVDFSRASDPHVTVAWTYTNPPPDLAGFHLYVNGVMAEDFDVPTATSWSGPVVLVDGNNTFEMAAYDMAGQEGEKSAPSVLLHDGPPGGGLIITDVHEN